MNGKRKKYKEFKKFEAGLKEMDMKIKNLEINSEEFNKLVELKKRLVPMYIGEKIQRCQHYIAYDNPVYQISTDTTIYDYYCPKCGLASELASYDREDLSDEDKVRYDYFESNGIASKKGNYNYVVDRDLAMSIYEIILEKNPGINSKTAIKYFEIALDNMIDKPVTDEAIEHRAERLGTNALSIRNIHRKNKN